jgi:RNA polymerase sigma-70 factor (ECF subfamily)
MAEPPSDDRELLRLLAKGNERAFDTVYGRYQGRIFRFTCHMTGNAAIAEEVTQEVFLQLIRNARAYDPERGSLAGYLLGIARNLLRRRLERSGVEIALPEEAEDWIESAPLASESNAFEFLDREELLESLQKAVSALPEQYREAVVLCDIEQLTYAEAASLLRCPPGTVASRLNRAHKMLRARMQRQGCAP